MARWPLKTAASAAMRSEERAFILWGMAEEPTCPGANPSVTSSWPTMSLMVTARLAGPDTACTRAATTSRSMERG